MKAIALNSWAGLRYYPVEVVGTTATRLRVKVLTVGGVMLPGRRFVEENAVTLVPKSAVFDMPDDSGETK